MLNVVESQLVEAHQPEADDLTLLLEAWNQQKTAELTANKRRLEIETQLALVLPAPEEGQKSYRIGSYKVTRTNRINYRGDPEKLKPLIEALGLPQLLKDAVNETAVKKLRREDPYDFELLVSDGALSAVPAKPGFEVALVATAVSEEP